MKSATEHYESHLANIYAWSVGGEALAIAGGRLEVDALGLTGKPAGTAIDLGAGFGKHSIPLAERGYQVEAVDSSRALLDQLERSARDLTVRTHVADMIDFMTQTEARADLVLCMGDTLTHLGSVTDAARLLSLIASRLVPAGVVALGFRDYSREPVASPMFIPVRADDQRILTCILEYGDATVAVHDLRCERADGEWKQSLSSYQKLRLRPDWVSTELASLGFGLIAARASQGMVTITAVR